MAIQKVTLEDMLEARERRAKKQAELIALHGKPLICFTMNIPGEIKRTPLVELAFHEGIGRIKACFAPPLFLEISTAHTGCEAFMVFDGDAQTLKRAAVVVEESGPAARLFDIDVIDTDGQKLTRGAQRRCTVCGGPVALCARSRAHGLAEITAAAQALMYDFASKKLARIAAAALEGELEATPKPGLVDLEGSGAHKDMDKGTFYASIEALEPYFERMARAAFDQSARPPAAVMETLRPLGIAAERAMLSATDGVNTHRGAIFSLGLMLAGTVKYLCDETPVLCTVRALAASGMEESLKRAAEAPATNGERVYAQTGVTGARGEAARGLPAARAALDVLEDFLDGGHAANDAAALTLPHIIEKLDDTNLIHRGGAEGLAFAKREAARINALPEGERLCALRALDAEFIKRNLSPGGAADALALALFMHGVRGFATL